MENKLTIKEYCEKYAITEQHLIDSHQSLLKIAIESLKEDVQEKQLVIVHSREHYAERIYLLTQEEIKILQDTEDEFGYLGACPEYKTVIGPILCEENMADIVSICEYS